MKYVFVWNMSSMWWCGSVIVGFCVINTLQTLTTYSKHSMSVGSVSSCRFWIFLTLPANAFETSRHWNIIILVKLTFLFYIICKRYLDVYQANDDQLHAELLSVYVDWIAQSAFSLYFKKPRPLLNHMCLGASGRVDRLTNLGHYETREWFISQSSSWAVPDPKPCPDPCPVVRIKVKVHPCLDHNFAGSRQNNRPQLVLRVLRYFTPKCGISHRGVFSPTPFQTTSFFFLQLIYLSGNFICCDRKGIIPILSGFFTLRNAWYYYCLS
jgi:hypothetical protein